MYRVELKVKTVDAIGFLEDVPNVPCGVESSSMVFVSFATLPVPNVPCGVERSVP